MKYLLILLIFVFSGFANNEKDTNLSDTEYAYKNLNLSLKEKEYIKNNPIIKVGFTNNFEPFLIQTPAGNIQGIIPDMYNHISRKIPLKFEYHINDWKTTLKNLEEGNVNLIPAINYNIAKKRGFLTATPLFKDGFQVYVKKGKSFVINSLNDLKGKRVGFNKNMLIIHNLLKNYKDTIKLVPFEKPLDLFYQLDNNSLDAIISFNSSRFSIEKNGFHNIKPAYNISEIKPAATTAIKANDLILQSIMDKAISDIKIKEKTKIIEKYLSNYYSLDDYNLTKEEKKYLDSKSSFRVEFENLHYPYSFIENGEKKGFFIDYINIISEKLNKKIEYITVKNKNEASELLKNNKIDLLSHYLKTPQRENEFLYAKNSVIELNIGLLSKKDKNYNLNNFSDQIVGVVKGYHIERLLQEYYPKITIKLFNNNFELIQSVLNETSDFAISNYSRLNYLIKHNQLNSNLKNKILNNKHFYTRQAFTVFNKSNEKLKSIFNKVIEATPKTELNYLQNKWFLDKKEESVLSNIEEEWLKENYSIKMCANPVWEPISFYNKETKKPEGISIDTMKLIEKKLSNKLRFEYVHTTSWKQSQEFLKQKKCDILPILKPTQKRKEYAILTAPYLSYKHAIITQENKPFARGLEDVINKPIARKEGSGLISEIKKQYPNAKIIETKNFLDSIKRVSEGEAYFALATLPVLSYNANRFSINNVQIAGYANIETFLSIGVRKDKVILRDILDKALLEITPEEHKAIQDKWMGFEIKEIKSNNTFYIILSLILLILVFYYFYRDIKSKKELKKINIKLKKFNETLEQKVNEQTKDLIKLNLQLSVSNEQLKTTNQELQNTNEELLITEEDLRIRQVELIHQHEEIIELSKIKAQFLANMSHEIRTPLNGIVGVTRLMLEDEDNISQIHKEQLNIIRKSSEILTNVVDDILDYSALSTGNISLFEEEFSLRSMIEHIKSITEIDIEKKGLKYIIDLDERIEDNLIGDEFRISQILMNIISNAKKFTKNGYIKLKIRKRKNEDKDKTCNLRFTIIDTGIGMNNEVQKSLFNSFIQSDQSNTRENKGTGLGLSIVQQLVNLMKGKITTQSILGQGSTFFVDIPLECTNNSDSSKSILNTTYYRLTQAKKALFVEDDEINQIVISSTLKKIGFDTDYANNGKEAIDKVKNNHYDIIFMDIQMPVMDGYEATRIIREDYKQIPIIALSAGVMPKDIDKSLKAGMNMHIAKPIVYNEMNEVLDKYFQVEIKE